MGGILDLMATGGKNNGPSLAPGVIHRKNSVREGASTIFPHG